jgi:hypothetical protein
MLTTSHNQLTTSPYTIEPIITLPDLEPPEITPFSQLPALDSYELESPDWLWPNHIPCGSITLLDGPTNSAKTRFLVDLAARVSSGQPMPDGSTGVHGSVIFISPFDPFLRHLNPAFSLAHADRSLIFSFSLTPDSPPSSWSTTAPASDHDTCHPFRFDDPDLVKLDRLIRHTFCRLLIIDSWSATLDDTRSFSQRNTARLLHALRTMVANHDLACILVRSSDPRTRTNTLTPADKSPYLPASAPTHLAVLPDPLTPDHSLLVSTKQTFSSPMPLLQFHLTAHPTYPQFPQLHWDGPSDLSIDDLSLSSTITTLAPTREHILRVLQQQPGTDPMTIPALLELLPHLSYELLRKTLQRMVRAHQLSSPRRGLYTLPPSSSHPDHLPSDNDAVPVALSPATVPISQSPSPVPDQVSPVSVPNTQSPPPVPNQVSPSPVPGASSQPYVPQAISFDRIRVPDQLSPSPVPNNQSQPITRRNIL